VTARRALQVGALAAQAILLPMLAARALHGGAGALVAGAVGWLAADLSSGVVHWLADRIGSARTPLVGPLIRSFREHHAAPEALLAHDAVETSGDHALIALLPAIPTALLARGAPASAFVLTLAAAVMLTGPIHKWAHAPRPPRLARALQRAGIILSPAHHRRHHDGGRDSHYCITCGWMDAPLEGAGVFRRLERLFARARGPGREAG